MSGEETGLLKLIGDPGELHDDRPGGSIPRGERGGDGRGELQSDLDCIMGEGEREPLEICRSVSAVDDIPS